MALSLYLIYFPDAMNCSGLVLAGSRGELIDIIDENDDPSGVYYAKVTRPGAMLFKTTWMLPDPGDGEDGAQACAKLAVTDLSDNWMSLFDPDTPLRFRSLRTGKIVDIRPLIGATACAILDGDRSCEGSVAPI